MTATRIEREAQSIASATEALDAIALQETTAAALLDRLDTKFLVPAALVPTLLEAAGPDYRALTIGGCRVARYRTTYYDTPAFTSYHDHFVGRSPRYKVRRREYVESDLAFLEVKWKTAGGRTVKSRTPFTGSWEEAMGDLCCSAPRERTASIPWLALQPVLRIDYDRVTLVSRQHAERVTIDLRLTMHREEERVVYPGVAVVELKHARPTQTGLRLTLRRLGFRPHALSKYCLGVARLHPDRVKTHGTRRLFNHLHQLSGGYHGAVIAQ